MTGRAPRAPGSANVSPTSTAGAGRPARTPAIRHEHPWKGIERLEGAPRVLSSLYLQEGSEEREHSWIPLSGAHSFPPQLCDMVALRSRAAMENSKAKAAWLPQTQGPDMRRGSSQTSGHYAGPGTYLTVVCRTSL